MSSTHADAVILPFSLKWRTNVYQTWGVEWTVGRKGWKAVWNELAFSLEVYCCSPMSFALELSSKGTGDIEV